ncbi:MAG: PIN domain-containing protein [Thermoplasmata archaeon]
MIFVDTSAWLALVDSHDKFHDRALTINRRIAAGEFGKQVTTNYVLAETLTLIRRNLGIRQAIALSDAIDSGHEVHVLWIEPVHHREAMKIMSSHSDKDWSVTDCSSFVVMRALAIGSAFTFDTDFAQAGFSIVD